MFKLFNKRLYRYFVTDKLSKHTVIPKNYPSYFDVNVDRCTIGTPLDVRKLVGRGYLLFLLLLTMRYMVVLSRR